MAVIDHVQPIWPWNLEVIITKRKRARDNSAIYPFYPPEVSALALPFPPLILLTYFNTSPLAAHNVECLM